jgi:hypothetical protein
MGTADSSMRDISQVERYSDNLQRVSVQMEGVFDQLKRQTDQV